MPNTKYTSLSVLIKLDTIKKAERLSEIMGKVMGVPVNRAWAVDFALAEAIDRAKVQLAAKKAAKP